MTRKMKDSGIEWVGVIPEDWNIYRLKNCILSRDAGAWGDEARGDENDYICIRIADFDYSRMTIKKDAGYEYTKRNYKPETVERLLLKKNDILIEKSGGGEKTPVGRTIIFDEDFPALYANFSERLRVNEFVVSKFMQYGFVTFYKNRYSLNYIKQTTGIQNLDITAMLAEEKIPIPSIAEQEKIVVFLDDKIGEVDTIISRTKESIEEYKKYKQAVITEVALGGLDKKVATKNSGIDWIGNIPEHWKIKPFKSVMSERNEKNTPVKTGERLALSIDKGITTYAEKTTNLDRFKDDVTQYKLAYVGDLVFNSMNMIVGAIGYSNYFGCVSPVYYTYYDNVEGHYTSKYYEYIFRSKTMRKVLFSLGKGIMAIDRGDDKINTCRLKVSRDDLRCLKVPVPTEQEQQEIVKYLDAKCAEIDALIAKKEAFVEEMEAYKKSLIYEYVTGKKEVL